MSDVDIQTGPEQQTGDAEDRPDGRPAIHRGRRGHFAKGQSANPAGRPPGSVSEAARITAAILNDEAEMIVRSLVEGAKWGKPVPLKLAMAPVIAQLKKHRPAFALPPVRVPDDVPAASAAIADAVVAGLLSPDEAAAFAQMLEAQARSLALAERIRADRLATDMVEVGTRNDLRIMLLFAFVASLFQDPDRPDGRLAELLQPVAELGGAAGRALAAIPESLELIASDRAFAAQHPFPAERPRHQLAEMFAAPAAELVEYLKCTVA